MDFYLEFLGAADEEDLKIKIEDAQGFLDAILLENLLFTYFEDFYLLW